MEQYQHASTLQRYVDTQYRVNRINGCWGRVGLSDFITKFKWGCCRESRFSTGLALILTLRDEMKLKVSAGV